MTDKEKKSKIADILMDFQEEYSNEVINRPMLASLYAGNILSFMNSLPNEPKKCMYTNEHYTDEDRKVLCEDCEERCEYSKKEESVSEQNLSNVQRIGKNWKEELVSEDLEEAARCFRDELHLREGKRDNYGNPYFTQDSILKTFKAGTKWKEEQMMKDAITARCFGFQSPDALFSIHLPAKGYLVGHELRVIIVKED